MNTVDIEAAAALLRAAEDILIITHIRPDGDTAGSGCALCLGLRALGKTAYLAANPPSMARYEPYMTPWFAPDGFAPRFVAAVDTPGPGQFPTGWESFAARTDLAIDHHGTNSGYARSTCLEADSAATGEIVYLLLKELGVALTAPMAEALYVALATDTNGFRTPGTTARTLTIAGALRRADFDAAGLTKRLFETKTPARLRLEAALYGGMRFPLPGVCVMTLDGATVAESGAEEDDMDKLSLLTTVPEGTWAGLLLRQLSDGTWKVSLRTDGSIHAGQVLGVLGGGGHADAAGAVTDMAPEKIISTVLASLTDNCPRKMDTKSIAVRHG